jgi:cellobiose transport system permease protein
VRLSDIDGAVFVGFGNYTELLQNEFFWNAARNTLTIGILSTVPQLAIALGLAHLLNYRLRGRTFFRVAMLMPYATSIAAATLVFAQLFGHDYGLINTLLEAVGFDRIDWESGTWTSQIAISVIVTWRWTGYNALIYLAAMQAIPNDLYEAATLDGASRWQQFLHVTVPALKPTILFTIVVSTIGAVQLFGEPLLFSGNGMTSGGVSNQYQTLGLLMYDQGWTNFRLGQAAATAWTMFLIILVVVGIYGLIARRRARAER